MQKRSIGLWLTVIGAVCLLPSSAAKPRRQNAPTASPVNVIGKKTYEHHCSTCHVGGDNRDNPNKPLAGSPKLKDLDTFKKFVGAGHVQFAQQLVEDKKSFEALYEYCKSLPKVASKQDELTVDLDDLPPVASEHKSTSNL